MILPIYLIHDNLKTCNQFATMEERLLRVAEAGVVHVRLSLPDRIVKQVLFGISVGSG